MTTFAAPTGPALNYDGSVRGHIDPTAYVGSKNVYVASTARVSDGAWVSGNARVLDSPPVTDNLSVACNRASKIAKLTGQTVFVYDGLLDGRQVFLCIQAKDIELSDLDRIKSVVHP